MNLTDYANLLLRGDDGKSVVDLMISEIEHKCSVRVAMTSVRNLILNGSDPRRFHPKHAGSIKNLKELGKTATVSTKQKLKLILNNNLKYRYNAKRKVRKDGYYFNNEDMDNILNTIEIFPDNMKTFILPKEIARACIEIAQHNLQVANENIKVIKNTTININMCIDYIEFAIKETAKRNPEYVISDKKLGTCLLAMSGRRTAEIFNGKSRFKKGKTPTTIMFDGQLKKNNVGQETVDKSYEIPLLCYSEIFTKGFNTLRKLQNYQEFTNKEVNAKYSTNVKYWSSKLFPIVPNRKSTDEEVTPHDLRRIYVVAVFEMYNYEDVRLGVNTVAKKILGHMSIDTSINYLSIRLNGLTAAFPDEYRLDLSSGARKIKRQRN
tara:strand:+ start:1261 stop:2397 length:1137 start_codon:yes stop_codon:yes gene_type:complete